MTIVAVLLALLLLRDDDEGGGKTAASGSEQEADSPPAPTRRAGPVIRGKKLTIYSSLPLEGPARPNSRSLNKGAQLALDQRGGRVGDFKIRFKRMDDATAKAGLWDPGKTLANARRAVRDKTTIAYIGEFNSGASAISMPRLNRARILQVSPSNTAVGLTESRPREAVSPGEPDVYYPTGSRHYGRMTPNDNVQGAALATDMKRQGCSKAFVVNDRELYGRGVARAFVQSAAAEKLEVAVNTVYDPRASNYRSLASRVRRSRADCFLGSVIVDNNGVRLFEDVASKNPDLRLWAPDGVADPAFTDPSRGGVSRKIGNRIRVAVVTLAPEWYPTRANKFFDDYTAAYGEAPESFAIYGYEAMSVILDAIQRAEPHGNARGTVIDQFFQTKDRDSVLGTYSIDENGDTSLRDYGIYTIAGGQLQFYEKITARHAR